MAQDNTTIQPRWSIRPNVVERIEDAAYWCETSPAEFVEVAAMARIRELEKLRGKEFGRAPFRKRRSRTADQEPQ